MLCHYLKLKNIFVNKKNYSYRIILHKGALKTVQLSIIFLNLLMNYEKSASHALLLLQFPITLLKSLNQEQKPHTLTIKRKATTV